MVLVGYRYSPPGHPPVPIPRVHPPYPPVRRQLPDMLSTQTEYGRGAQIGSSTHFQGIILAVKRYYRGL